MLGLSVTLINSFLTQSRKGTISSITQSTATVMNWTNNLLSYLLLELHNYTNTVHIMYIHKYTCIYV